MNTPYLVGAPTEASPEALDQYRTNISAFLEAADRYRYEPGVRNTVDQSGPREIFEFFGLDSSEVKEGTEVNVLLDQNDLVHFVVGEDPNVVLTDEALGDRVVGGATAGTAGTISSLGTFACSTAPGCISSAYTAGTAGSAS